MGEGYPCRFVAELSNNWRTKDTPAVPTDADRDRMGRLIDAAKAAGADFIKTQCYTPDELVALRGDGPAPDPWGKAGWSMRDLYTHAQTPFDWFPKIKAHCERVGIPWFSSVFGKDSLALLESLDCPAYKVARLDIWQRSLRGLLEPTKKPLLVSTNVHAGGGFIGMGAFLLWCPPGYPQTEFGFRPFIRDFDDPPKHFGGFSYHGTDPLVPTIAVACGVKLVEVHFMLRDEPSVLESNVSLDEYQFAKMVESVRRTEEILG